MVEYSKNVILATWNVATLRDNENPPDNDRPERRTDIIARELNAWGIDIAVLSEMRLDDDNIIEEVGRS